MLIDPEKVELRVGATDHSYLNIDYHGKEIGYVKHTAAGYRVWTYEVSNRLPTSSSSACAMRDPQGRRVRCFATFEYAHRRRLKIP